MKRGKVVADKVTLYVGCSGISDCCRARCGAPISICRRANNKGRPVPGEHMTCACGEPNIEGHKEFCFCQPGQKQFIAHFQCEYKLKIVLESPDFAKASIFTGHRNDEAHVLAPDQKEVKQFKHKLPESVKNDFDRARLQDKVTPAQFAHCTARFVRSVGSN